MSLYLTPKNKKGDIPTTLLVIGVIALCGLAIFMFLNSLNKSRDSFDHIEEIEKANMKIEEDSLDEYHKKINDSHINIWEFKKEERIVFSIDYPPS